MHHTINRIAIALAASVLLPMAAHAGDHGKGHHQDHRLPQVGSFALIGDTPYGVAREPQFDRVIDDINANGQVRFVVHTGDIKAGSERCDDALLIRRFEQYQQFDLPFILTPGDNEWTDCHRTNNGNYLPTERLARVREIFYPEPGVTTGGRRARVETQAHMPGYETFVENTLWQFAGTVMGTIHVVGSNNNLAPWNQIDPNDSTTSPRADRMAEFEAREAAAVAWIDAIFARAQATRARGVLIAMQANPNFELDESDPQRAGFNKVLAAITEHAIAFGKPVVIAHGDSHYFRVDKPLLAATVADGLQSVENVTRVENFGSQHVHWVEVTVDPRDENVFGFRQHIVKANAFAR
jgi:hypothetical protein